MIFVANAIFSQKLPAGRSGLIIFPTPARTISLTNYFANSTSLLLKTKEVITPDFYVRQLPFFCRQEIKFEKTIKIPFRFRVGSVEDCNRMEGKNKRN